MFSNEHTIQITAQPADIDENGHVSNLVYLRWVLEAAVSHSTAVGWPHARYLEFGAVFVVRRHEIDYLAATMLGDVVHVTTYVDSWSAATSVRKTRIVKDGKELARCVTTWAFIGLNGRPRRIAPELVEAFRA
jgi:acyl-CoA thioester hydrolase